jgi:hypothetical protein
MAPLERDGLAWVTRRHRSYRRSAAHVGYPGIAPKTSGISESAAGPEDMHTGRGPNCRGTPANAQGVWGGQMSQDPRVHSGYVRCVVAGPGHRYRPANGGPNGPTSLVSYASASMVRKGSAVRVRCWACEVPGNRGFCGVGSLEWTPSITRKCGRKGSGSGAWADEANYVYARICVGERSGCRSARSSLFLNMWRPSAMGGSHRSSHPRTESRHRL